jgi:hypothetical protein
MDLTKYAPQEAYIEGFLTGQLIAYCEQVRLGSRLAGAINCDNAFVDKLMAIASQEGCRTRIVPIDSARASLWIYKYEFLTCIIDHLQSAPENDASSDYMIWATGKLFGYADCEIAKQLTK